MPLARTLAAVILVGAAATSLPAQTRIAPGQTVRGSLTAGDSTLADGSHYDLYTFAGRSGQTVTVTMRSGEFDAYLAVGRVSGGEFVSGETDDDGAGGTDAQVTYTLPAAGEYAIRANSLSDGQTGAYTLELSTGAVAGNRPVNDRQAGSRDVIPLLLDSAGVVMRNGGFTPRGETRRGTLAGGASADLSVDVAAGSSVIFVGVCGVSCSDLDMTVFGPDGAEVGSDVLPDDAPMVAVQNARAGTYRVRVTMASCSTARCDYGVQTFGTP